MRSLHFLFCLPIALAPFLIGDKKDEKAPPPAAAAPSLVPPQVLMPLESIIQQLAKGAREREVKDLLRALEKFGYPQAKREGLEKAAKEALTRAKTPLDSLPAGAKQLRATAMQLVAIMDKITDEEQKKVFAKGILILDGECEAAHKALGNEKVGHAWVRKEFVEMRQRRGEILNAVEEAKKLEIDMEAEENVADEIVEKVCGVKATVVRRGRVELRSNLSLEKTKRIMREVNRAIALSRWIRAGQMKPLDDSAGMQSQRESVVLIGSRDMFKKYAAEMLSTGKMTEGSAKNFAIQGADPASFTLKDGPKIQLAPTETNAETTLLVMFAGMADGIRTPLTAGHLNWISLVCFGSLLPEYIVKESDRKRYGDTKVAGEEREQQDLLRLAKSGIAGSRRWMEYLAERGEDPLWGNSFVNSLGEITGDDLHKCTSIAEYLHEVDKDTFKNIYTRLGTASDDPPVQRFISALQMQIGELESKWREWLLGSKPGVAERIDKEALNAWPADALAVLKYMNEIRQEAFKGRLKGAFELKFDPDLSEQCAAHALYLTKNPDQRKWPEMYEEFPDKEGYSVEGAWAAAHSVIMFGNVEGAKDAIDGWMGMFHNRLPLLDPGVLRLGWGQEGDVWVLDMQSLAVPHDQAYLIPYPFDGQTGVPTSFWGNVNPDVVPEEGKEVNEAEVFGYPITIQTNPIDENRETVDILMKLFEGKDTEVECHHSSPEKPTNPELAPKGAWCLIPKAKLKPQTEYKVVAEWRNSAKKTTAVAKRMEWTFKTK